MAVAEVVFLSHCPSSAKFPSKGEVYQDVYIEVN